MSNVSMSQAQRLDQRVIELLPRLSRAFAAALIEQGRVHVNGTPVLKPGYKLKPADIVETDYDSTQIEQIPTVELPVLYEDDDCVVINKPVGLLVHSKGSFNPEATVATWLRARLADEAWAVKDGETNNRAGIVHRLDRATSGVMICAKHQLALSWLQRQFSQRKVRKIYMAIVAGRLTPEQAVIDMPIERNPARPQLFRVGSRGKAAETAYEVVQTTTKFSLVELRPQTGRTHQLRVHLAYLGHPILGDTVYGGVEAPRLYLHAQSLELTLLSRQRHTFIVPLPPEFKRIVST